MTEWIHLRTQTNNASEWDFTLELYYNYVYECQTKTPSVQKNYEAYHNQQLMTTGDQKTWYQVQE